MLFMVYKKTQGRCLSYLYIFLFYFKLVFITFYIKDHYTIRMCDSTIIFKLFYNVISPFITTKSTTKSRYIYSIFFSYIRIYYSFICMDLYDYR